MRNIIKEVRRFHLYHGDGAPMLAQTIGRNQPCPCGSGKKAKACCGTETKYFNPSKTKAS